MKRRIRSTAMAVVVVLGMVGATLLVATPAGAATFNPTADPTVDGAAGSLRAAIAAATNAGGDDIVLVAGGTYTLTCGGGGALSHGATPLTITGNGATIVQTCADSRVLGTLGSLTLDDVTITGGNGAAGDGAGVFSNTGAAATLVITNSTITGNTSTNTNASGGGLYTSAVTTITNSVISDNHASGTGSTAGGIYSVGISIAITDSEISSNSATVNGGGIRNSAGTLSMTRSTVSGNNGGAGAGASGGGLLMQGGNATIVDSTISGNQAWGGAGFFRDASGPGDSVTFTGSTISGNIVGPGGGGGATSLQPMVFVNSTVSNNTGTGITANTGTSPAISLTYSTVVSNSDATHANLGVIGGLSTFGSVIALPLGGGDNCNIQTGGVISNGYNYSDDSSCLLTYIADVQGGAPPVLGALAANGGPTLTRVPADPGPLVDQIPPALCAGGMVIVVDQRGFPRPETGGTLCDIGAVEVQANEPTPPAAPGAGVITIVPTFTG